MDRFTEPIFGLTSRADRLKPQPVTVGPRFNERTFAPVACTTWTCKGCRWAVRYGAGPVWRRLFHTFFIPTKKNATRRWRKLLAHMDFLGGRCRDRTCDPCRVKAVLYR